MKVYKLYPVLYISYTAAAAVQSLSHVQLFATLWTTQPDRLLCLMEIPRQEY